MESFEFIESGLVLGLDSLEKFKKFKHVSNDFIKHRDAFKFLTTHLDTYGTFPSSDLLCENFPTLDTAAVGLNFDYAQERFKNQIIFRQIVNVFQTNKEVLRENPKEAFSRIQSALDEIGIVYDDDVIAYDAPTADDRFDRWANRKAKRALGKGVMGIPTPFTSLNELGVGWLPGDLVAMYARPTVGKTWFCCEVAVEAAFNGFKTLFISTEMTVESINLRLDVIMAHKMGYRISHRALRHGEDIDEAQYKDFLGKLDSSNLLVCDHITGQNTISMESVAGLIRKHSPDFVVLDGIYLIASNSPGKAMWEQSHSLFYEMKNLARSQNVALFVSTQANREAADMYTPPTPSQVAFGDALIRAADIAVSMCRVSGAERLRLAAFQKYRDGELPLSELTFEWDVNYGNITETTSVSDY
jgi:replicative DNA helicase|tara:strand:+ start:1309 stop:2553 length:1245 start_codon:yes stop_codon:yes gene_type:complete